MLVGGAPSFEDTLDPLRRRAGRSYGVEVVVGLLSHATAERLRVRVQVPESDPTCPSLFDVHPGSEGLEREVFDMFGISFEGHPDLTRILMPEDWEGHPLRKDHPAGEIPVQFKGVQNAR